MRQSASHQIMVAHFRPDIVSGAERSIADMVEQLKASFAFTMLVPAEGRLAEYYRGRGFMVRVKNVQNYRRKYPGLHHIQSLFFALEMKKAGVGAVISNTFPAASRVGTAARMAQIPHAIYVREYITYRPVTRRILDRAQAVYAISKDLCGYLAPMAGTTPVFLAYNYIDSAPILERAARHQSSGTRLLPFSAGNPVVGLIGRVAPFKQQDLFLEAVPRVLARAPEARFVIVGSAEKKDLGFEAGLKAQAQRLGIADRVAFMGQRADTIEITSELAITCLTSTREPLGRVILEGSLLGVPVVSTGSGGADEIIDEGETGLKFDALAPGAPDRLAACILRLLHDPTLRAKLAAGAKEKMMRTFASDQFVKIQAQRFHDLCEHHAR